MGTAVQGRDGHVRMPGGRLKDGKEVGEEQQWAGDITGLYRSSTPKAQAARSEN